MNILCLVLLVGLLGVSWTQTTNQPALSNARDNCFRRTICGGYGDRWACLDNKTRVYCFGGDEITVQPCFDCVDGACNCSHCDLNNSTGNCDPDTGACECRPEKFGYNCEFTTPCYKKLGFHCFGAMNLSPSQASLASAPNVLTRCGTETDLLQRRLCASSCTENEFIGSCLCNCSGRGRCNTETGVCICEPGWGGTNCSMQLYDPSQICVGAMNTTAVCVAPDSPNAMIVFCFGAKVIRQSPCFSGICGFVPNTLRVACAPDSFPCPLRDSFGTCTCGPTSIYDACDHSIEFCDHQWDGSFCINSSTVVNCYGGRLLNSTKCALSETCDVIGINTATCVELLPEAPTLDFPPGILSPALIDRYYDDSELVPTFARCASRWAPNVCLSDVLLLDCSTNEPHTCKYGCISTENGAECRCNCGDEGPHKCIRPWGLCMCSAGWSECPMGQSGPDCSVLDRCFSLIKSGKHCNPDTSELVRCHAFNLLNNVTCAKGCKEDRTDCACGKCVFGRCNPNGTCVCNPGYRGETCSEGGECVLVSDGVRCWDTTHYVVCLNSEPTTLVPCKSGVCSELCGWDCCPEPMPDASIALFSTLSTTSVTLGAVSFVIIIAASLYGVVSLGRFYTSSNMAYQLQVYDGDTLSDLEDEQEEKDAALPPRKIKEQPALM